MQELAPYKKGYFTVKDGHELYYELCGNPNGKPLLFVHGGPGGGFHDDDKEYFDPTVWNLIFFDQRGAGRSKPFASLKNNTTQKLVEDIRLLLDYVGIEKTMLFGGSWGSTLSLVYAITHPETVSSMLLRGIWLVNQRDKHYFMGGGSSYLFPEAWAKFVARVPEQKRDDIVGYYLSQMQSTDKKVREKYLYEWAYYESSILRLRKSEERIQKDMSYPTFRSLSLIEAHYIANNCFIPENFILDNSKKIAHIPTTIIHGRYDAICPAENAYLLHNALKHSKLVYTIAGHAGSDEENKKALIEELKLFYT